jgi:endoglucanase
MLDLVIGRGINLGGAFDRRDGREGWRVRAEHLDAIAVAGFNSVRLPVRWAEGLLEPVAALVEAAWARDLAVVVTNHHDDEAMADPLGSVPRLTHLWRRLTAHFVDTGGPLAFELLNEPRMSADDWNALLPSVLAAVREVDSERPVVVGGADASTVPGLHRLELPPDNHLIATVHYYEPFAFTHQDAAWEPGADAWLGTTWGTQADREAVTADLASAAAWASERGVPLYVSEFGTVAAADRASRLHWTAWVRHELERLQLPWAYWDFATDFGVYDLTRGGWDTELLAALIERG